MNVLLVKICVQKEMGNLRLGVKKL
jgi:hypothetical protein